MEGANSSTLFSVNSTPSSNTIIVPAEVPRQSPILKSDTTHGIAITNSHTAAASSSVVLSSSSRAGVIANAAITSSTIPSDRKVLDKRRLQDLAKEVDPLLQLDEDVEEMLLQIADDFIDNVVSSACELAKHRKANTLEIKDLHLVLERNYNMWVPGLGSDELRPYKKAHITEAHKQRMALIKKTIKKF